MNDTGTRDALPLLAFTLRRLYERFGGDGRLTVDEYASLGPLGRRHPRRSRTHHHRGEAGPG